MVAAAGRRGAGRRSRLASAAAEPLAAGGFAESRRGGNQSSRSTSGAYADGSGQTWRVSWNPSATALQGARGVSLFVRDGEDQNRIDLAPQDLASGTYQYQPKGQDVTFRLEVTGKTGQVSAESFRLVKTGPPEPAKPVQAKAEAPRAPAPAAESRRFTPPRAIHKAPPVVPASIRPRIRGSVPIDIRVRVDTRGRVVSAAPVTKPHFGLNAYLAGTGSFSRAAMALRTGAPERQARGRCGNDPFRFRTIIEAYDENGCGDSVSSPFPSTTR